MTAQDVLEVYDACEHGGVEIWLDGGWGVDALLGEQTREHDDLDIVVAVDHLPSLIVALSRIGFVTVKPWPDSPEGFVVADPRDRRVDIHPLRFDEEGNGRQRLHDGTEWLYPAQGLCGSGVVDGRSVRCLTPELQVQCHAGYELQDDDVHDMRELHERLGVELLPAQRAAIERAAPAES
jgi:lincosamide nucleotidyltransferase A/C/D/E